LEGFKMVMSPDKFRLNKKCAEETGNLPKEIKEGV
jgi:hypothetical protein